MTEKSKESRNDGNNFWLAGDGMIRRDHNIDRVKNLIKSGLSYNEIYRRARRYFRSKTFDEYYHIALDEINAESETESATDYMKRKSAEKEKDKE